MPINGGHAYSNHVVVTPHGRTVGEAGGGARGPTDVADTGGQSGLHLSTSHYPPMTRGSIAGYTGFIPGQHQQVGLNYHSASDSYFTDLERQADTRSKDRDKARNTGSAGAGRQGLNTRSTSAASPAPTAAPAAVQAAATATAAATGHAPAAGQSGDPGHIDNKYSRYANAPNNNTKERIPIAGYGGFVPLARTTQIGVGKPFQQFTNEGFSKMHEMKDIYRSSHSHQSEVVA